MERCGSRRSEAPPRLQVIGFNVSPPIIKGAEAAPAAASRGSSDMASSTAASCNELPISPSHLSKPATSSPRSALQQLLLHQSLPSTSPTSSNHSLPPLQPSPNQNSKLGLLQPDHPSSLGAAANHNRPSVLGTLLQSSTSDPSPANQKSTSGISKLQSPPSAYQGGRPRCLVQSELITSDVSANQSFHTSFFRLKSQLQYDNSSASSGDSQAIGQCDVKPAKAVVKESCGAIFQIKIKAGDDKNVAKAHEAIKSTWLSSKSNHSHAAKSRKSSWLPTDGNDSEDADDDDYADDYVEDVHPSAAERCKKSSLLPGVQSSTKHSPDNEKDRNSNRYEEKSKKSSLLFVVSSPAPDYPHQRHSAEHKSSKAMDFLSSCHLCRCPLGPDQDVFMYSGDKAFCSMECRYQQIIIDERKERRPPSIIRSGASPELHRTSVPVTATHRPMMNNKPYFINTAAVA